MPDTARPRKVPERGSLTRKTIPYLRQRPGQLIVINEMAAELGMVATTLYGQLKRLAGPMGLDRSVAGCVRVPPELPEEIGELPPDPRAHRKPATPGPVQAQAAVPPPAASTAPVPVPGDYLMIEVIRDMGGAVLLVRDAEPPAGQTALYLLERL